MGAVSVGYVVEVPGPANSIDATARRQLRPPSRSCWSCNMVSSSVHESGMGPTETRSGEGTVYSCQIAAPYTASNGTLKVKRFTRIHRTAPQPTSPLSRSSSSSRSCSSRTTIFPLILCPSSLLTRRPISQGCNSVRLDLRPALFSHAHI